MNFEGKIDCCDITWFREWLQTEEAKQYLKIIQNEKIRVKKLVKELSKMNKDGEEFTNRVLNELHPYSNKKFAEIACTFSAFMKIKDFFKNYSDKDWNKIAKMIFSLTEESQKDPDNLEWWIKKFTSDKIHSKGLQCGYITPILFCINDLFPLINNKVINTYKIFANKLGWDDRISQKLDGYMKNIPKCQKLMDRLGMEKMDFLVFDLFCFQYDQNKDEVSNLKPRESTPKTFTPIESWDFIQQRIHQLPPPDLKSLDSIIDNIQDGKYAIPIFQREYTWTRKQVEELWESIFQGFFVGSILTWDYNSQIETIPVFGAPPLRDQTDIILDGQQRITSLFQAVVEDKMHAGNKRILFFVNLKALLDPDADTEDIVFSEFYDIAKKRGYLSEKNQFTKKIFPMTQFHKRDYTLWLARFKEYLNNTEQFGSKSDAYCTRIREILDYVWFKYDIPVVKLPKTISLANVAEIFEKINSKGTRLGVFDLLNARFTKYDINLRELWDDAKSNFLEIKEMDENFGDAAKYTLQGLCLFKKRFVRRKELLTLDNAYKQVEGFQKEEFQREWDDICEHIRSSIIKLKSYRPNGFGAVKLSMTPYTIIVPILAALSYKIEKRNDDTNCMKKIECWYWSVVTSDSYSGSTDSKIEKDYRELLRWFDNCDDKPEIVEEQKNNIDSIEINTTKTNSSIYKTIICLICKAGANDFRTGRTPEYSAVDDHHIFPKSLADNYKSSTSINSILNRTIIDSNTNRNFLKDKKPSEYIKEIMQEQRIDELEMRKRLKTHLISDDAFDCLLDNDFDGFVNVREDTIRNELRKFVISCP